MTESYRDQFERRYPAATSNEPLTTALVREEDIQAVATHLALLYLNRPKWWIIPMEVKYGEMHLFEIGNVIEVTANSPGLENGRRLLIKGRVGGVRDDAVELECWG